MTWPTTVHFLSSQIMQLTVAANTEVDGRTVFKPPLVKAMGNEASRGGGGDGVGNGWALLSEEPGATLSCKSVKDIWFSSPLNLRAYFH